MKTRIHDPRARRPRRRAAALLVAAALLGVTALPPPVAAAEPVTPGIDHDAAFRRGLRRYDSRDYLGAIAVWENLLSTMDPQRGWKLLYNLGLAYQGAGNATQAIERFELFIRRAEEQRSPALAARHDDAVEQVRALKAAHGAVHVAAPASGEVVMARVDADAPRVAGFTVYLAPGSHEVELGAGTARARRLPLAVTAGGLVEVDASDSRFSAPGAPGAPRASASRAPASTGAAAVMGAAGDGEGPERSGFPTGWLLLGVGATGASVALPLVLGFRAASLREDALTLGRKDAGYSAAVSDYEGARTAYYASIALPLTLAAVTAAIPITYAAGAWGTTPRPAQVEVRAWAGPQGGHAWVQGSF